MSFAISTALTAFQRRIAFFKQSFNLDMNTLINTDTMDCVWSSFTLNNRDDRYAFTDPYMQEDETVLLKRIFLDCIFAKIFIGLSLYYNSLSEYFANSKDVAGD